VIIRKIKNSLITHNFLFFNRFPSVAIKKNSGNIHSTKCSCLVRLSGQCSHIASVLYLLEDISFDGVPRLYETPTDRACYWGKGATTKRNPKPIGKIL
jgi:hypothetical protein